MLLSAASMLDHLSLNDERDAIRRSIYKVLIDGKVRTEDLGGMHNFLLSSLHYHCKLMKIFFGPSESAAVFEPGARHTFDSAIGKFTLPCDSIYLCQF